MSPSDNIPQVSFLAPSRTRYSNSTEELQKIQENTNDEVRLDKGSKNLFPEAHEVFEQAQQEYNEQSKEGSDFEVVKKKLIKVKYQNN